MVERNFSRLKRKRYDMPDDVKHSLVTRKLLQAYQSRPPYQQNDYLGWILQAKREETRQKRITQMLEELAQGNVYMKMKYHSKC